MCRLMGFASATSRSLTEIVGPEQASTFQQLGSVHRDGWGTAWLEGAGVPGIVDSVRRTAVGSGDAELTGAIRGSVSRSEIFHLRWASPGLPVQVENNHPFTADGLAFAHNGNITPLEPLRELLDEESAAGLNGVTDSEMYFALIRQRVREGLELEDAVVRVVTELREIYPRSSLNGLLLTPDRLIAISASAKPRASNTLRGKVMPAEAAIPKDHLDNYYDFWMLRGQDSIAFSSSGIDNEGWEQLRNCVTVVDLDTLDTRVRDLNLQSAGIVGEAGL